MAPRCGFATAALLTLALLVPCASSAPAAEAAVKQPQLMWGQNKEFLFVQVVLPPPVEPVEVWFNDSHVRIKVDAGEPTVHFSTAFELREDVQAWNSSWLMNRNGVKLNLHKAVDHRFDRLLVRLRPAGSFGTGCSSSF